MKQRMKFDKQKYCTTLRRFIGIFIVSLPFSIIISVIISWVEKQFGEKENIINILSFIFSGTVAIYASVVVLHGFDKEEKAIKKQNKIEEAQFVLEFNKSFIQDQQMMEFETILEDIYESEDLEESKKTLMENKQTMINYLVYHEGLAPIVLNGIISLDMIDDLMAYRFFLVVDNEAIQKLELEEWAEYYKGCFKLYKKWKEYRIQKGYPILQEETSLDKWFYFELYASDVIIRPIRDNDNFREISCLIYDIDSDICKEMYGSKKKAEKIVSDLLKREEGILKKENILIAEKNKEIVGMILFVSKAIESVNQHEKKSYQEFMNKYLGKIEEIRQGDVCIAGVSVNAKYRRRHIATILIKYVIKKYEKQRICVRVLEKDGVTKELYKKLGFEEKECCSLSILTKEDYIKMVRKQDKE